MSIYPNITDPTMPYDIDLVYPDKPRLRYEVGETLIHRLMPGLHKLLAECAAEVAKNANAEMPTVGAGIAEECLIHKLADFLKLPESECDNVARPAWLMSEPMIREVLTLPTLDDYREWKTQPIPVPAPAGEGEEGDEETEASASDEINKSNEPETPAGDTELRLVG